MFRLFPLLLLALPFAEIAMFIVVGRAIGLWPTLGLVILSIGLGIFIVKSQGLAHLARMRSNLQSGSFRAAKPVVIDMLHSLMLAVAGILFVIPGFLTDILAILLLLPPVRSLLGMLLLRNMTIVTARPSAPNAGPQGDDIIEGEFTETRNTETRNNGQPPILPRQYPPQDGDVR